jgi:electron transport complex protein RnfG
MRRALVSAFSLLAFTLAFTFFMAFTYEMTRERIGKAAAEQKMRLIAETLPGLRYDNALLEDVLEVENGAGGRVGKIWRARNAGAPVALVLETFAPDGYGGRIDLIVSLDNAGRIGGVRVAAHHETPGLGDYIDPAKDRKKENLWISQFIGADAAAPARQWEVKKDGGSFDYRAGATVSARAVTRAVARAAIWANTHREALFAAPAGKRLKAGQEE